MANILEKMINEFNGININNYRDIRMGINLAGTYSKLVEKITEGFKKLPKSPEEGISHEPKTVTVGLIRNIREDVNNIRPPIHEISYGENTPYKDKDMDKAEKNSNTTWDREDI